MGKLMLPLFALDWCARFRARVRVDAEGPGGGAMVIGSQLLTLEKSEEKFKS